MLLIDRNIFVAVLLFLLPATLLAQQEARKVDEMGQIGCEEIKVRLDQLEIEMQANLNHKAYLIFYGGRKYLRYEYNEKKQAYNTKEVPAKRFESVARLRGWEDYLTFFKSIEKSRFEIINGGYREKFTIEFWLVPAEAKPPEPSPTLTEKDIKFGKGRPKNVSFQHWNC